MKRTSTPTPRWKLSFGEAGYAGEVGTGTVFDGHCWKVKVIMT